MHSTNISVRIGCGLLLAALLQSHASPALACACCSSEGQRNVGIVALDSSRRETVESLHFSGKAMLFTGEADAESVKGITTPSTDYDVAATWQDNRLMLSFRDKQGRSGTLSLARPTSISVFEVDPRSRSSSSGDPVLYKEWKLSGQASGSGVFQPGGAPGHILTLILHGNGNSCTSAADFSHWTLVMQGPKANFSLFGDLAATR
jgi:hypothetical protein